METKIPFLGDIPLIGNLFKHKVDSNTKNELMIFLTPHIVPMPTQLAGLAKPLRRTARFSLLPLGSALHRPVLRVVTAARWGALPRHRANARHGVTSCM